MPPSPPSVVAGCLAAVLPAGARLGVAVSGGSDSVGLMGLLVELGHAPVVLHVDHGLRPDSAADADFVAALAGDLGLELERAGPPRGRPRSSETAARSWRLDGLVRMAGRLGLDAVLTAHHLDDALETGLLHLLRGHRGHRARAGVPTLRPLAGPADQRLLLRPLLCGRAPVGRDALVRWREGAGLPFREDPTNADPSIPRNRVRSLLGADEPPLTLTRLIAMRRGSVAALEADVCRAAALLEQGLEPEPDGVRLARPTLEGATDPGTLTELLGLFGRALDPPRRWRLRASLLQRLAAALEGPGGRLPLSSPEGVEHARVDRRGLLIPAARPAPGRSAGRVLAALARGSLFL